jgi:tetratricopeptide (TPR) repeat protein
MLVSCLRYDEAVEMIRSAREVDPLSPIINSNVGQFLFMAGRFDEALAELDRCLERNPGFYVAERFKAFTLIALGRSDEAISILERHAAAQDDVRVRSQIAFAHARAGDTTRARQWIVRAEAAMETKDDHNELAVPYFALGEFDQAFSMLQAECARRNRHLRGFGIWVRVLGLEGDSRTKDLLRCMNVPGF